MHGLDSFTQKAKVHIRVYRPGLINGSPGDAVDPIFGFSLNLFEPFVMVSLERFKGILELLDPLLVSLVFLFFLFLCILKAASREKLLPNALQESKLLTVGSPRSRAELQSLHPVEGREGGLEENNLWTRTRELHLVHKPSPNRPNLGLDEFSLEGGTRIMWVFDLRGLGDIMSNSRSPGSKATVTLGKNNDLTSGTEDDIVGSGQAASHKKGHLPSKTSCRNRLERLETSS
uniref:Uncharacterized protein n=1 Tax=Cannabis sativa TaxID=3483 RepID=A0A803PBK7_CANSA